MKYNYVLGVSVLPRSAILIFDFGIVPTAWYVLFFILLLIIGMQILQVLINEDVKKSLKMG